MARPTDCPRILCGDFNEPRKEQRNGRVITWANYNKYSKSVDPDAWDKAVKSIFNGLPEQGVRDAVRYVMGERVIHQVSYPAKGNGKSRRYDHVFASEQLRPVEARYIEVSRKVSDHRPVLVVFEDQ
jgi:endonuclease/exonuclease/phosphatase family metal-dependent hydrolase